jgi:hypothetical protein
MLGKYVKINKMFLVKDPTFLPPPLTSHPQVPSVIHRENFKKWAKYTYPISWCFGREELFFNLL